MGAVSNNSLPYSPVGTELPIGNADFRSLRVDGCIYVDKADMILELLRFKKVFLSRPRRFGKTLLVSTLETLFRDGLKYFQGARRLYIDGEYVEEPFDIVGRWQYPTYPVVRLDFSFLKDCKDLEGLSIESIFREEVVVAFERVGFHFDRLSPVPWMTQLKSWLTLECSLSRIVLLIDEYDAGLGSRLDDEASFSRVLSMLSAFFTMVKSASSAWKFVFITGIARFGKASIFSSMNDVTDISFDPHFGTLLGYTEEELRKNFTPYLEEAAAVRKTDVDGLLYDMRKYYDGFCFDERALTHVYAPWSVLYFLADRRHTFRNYWADSSGNPSALVGYIKSGKASLRTLASEVTVPLARLKSIMSLADLKQELILNQAGYLSIAGIKADRVILAAPNLEVAATLADLCLSNLLPENGEVESPLPNIYDALQTGDSDVWAKAFNAYLSEIPYLQYPIDSEAAVRGFALAVILGKGIDCEGERANAWGRSDLEVRMPNLYWAMEFKFVRREEQNQEDAVKKALNQAVSQMRQRRYAEHVANLPVVRVALVFSESERLIVAHEQV